MRKIFALAAGVLHLELKDRSTFIWMLIMPVAFIALFGGMFRGDRASLTSLTVVDGDDSFLSHSFVEALKSEELALKVVGPTEADTAKGTIRSLSIPRGFSDSLATGRHVGLTYNTGKSRNQDYDLAAKVYVYKAVARTLAILAEMDTTTAEHTLAVDSEMFRSQYRSISQRPDLIRTEVRVAGRGRSVPTGFAGSAQAMLVLFLLMNTTISGAVTLTQEKQSRVLARLATLPLRRGELIAGKVLGLLGLALLQCAIVIVFGRVAFHVSWGSNPLALFVLLVCLGLAAAALGIFLGGLLRTPEQAGAVGWIVPLFLAAIGGTWWPLEIVPSWMQVFGHISPAAWAMDGMHGLIAFGKGGAAVVVPCLVLVGYAVVLTFFGARALRVAE